MTKVQWRRVFAISSLVMALMLIAGSIYLHLKQKHHLGRMNHEYNREESTHVTYAGGVDAAVIIATTTESDILTQMDSLVAGVELNRFHHENPLYNNHEYGDYEYDDDINLAEVIDFSPGWIDMETSQSSYSESESIENELAVAVAAISARHISEACMQCICEASTACKPLPCTAGGASCGIFRISQIYWQDAGEPTVVGDNSVSDDMGYSHCVNNAYCASRAVTAFVNKYARDCNHDGTIDCRDHVALHLLGPSGCMLEEMTALFDTRMETCLSNFE